MIQDRPLATVLLFGALRISDESACLIQMRASPSPLGSRKLPKRSVPRRRYGQAGDPCQQHPCHLETTETRSPERERKSKRKEKQRLRSSSNSGGGGGSGRSSKLRFASPRSQVVLRLATPSSVLAAAASFQKVSATHLAHLEENMKKHGCIGVLVSETTAIAFPILILLLPDAPPSQRAATGPK
jgi:hypothetical protein